MSTEIDEKVVEMRFDNRQFEKGVQTSLSTIDKLRQSLDLNGATKGLENVDAAARRVNMSGLGSAVEAVGLKFNAMYTIADQALRNITNSAMHYGKKIVDSLTIEPVKMGFKEYETQINSVQTILANTKSKGSTLDDVNGALDELNTYADKTIYNFTEMTRNIGTFTAAGVDLETSVSSIKGIANLAAVSGSTSQQASTAMYQLSQALAAGKVQLMDWNSVVNAGMGGQVFQDALKRTATNMGTNVDAMIKKYGSFRESLTQGEWLTSEVLTETLTQLSGAYTEADLLAKGYTKEQAKEILELADTAVSAATEVKTFTQLFDTLKEAAQSGWTQTWELIVGDFEEAKGLLTNISNVVGNIINGMSEARNKLLQGWKDAGGRDDLLESFSNIWEGLKTIVTPIKEAFREIIPPITVQHLVNFTKGLKDLTAKFKLSDTASDNLKRTFKGLFAIVDIVRQVFVAIVKALGPILVILGKLVGVIFSATAFLGDWIVKFNDLVKGSDVFNKVLQGLVGVITKVVNAIEKLFSIVKQKLINPGWEAFHGLLERIYERFSGTGEAAEGFGAKISEMFKSLGSAISGGGFMKTLKSVWDTVVKIGSKLTEVLGSVFEKLAKSAGNANFSGVMDFLNLLATGGIGVGIFAAIKGLPGGLKDIFKGIAEPVSGLKGIVDGFTDILDGLKGCLEAYQTQLKAGALIKIATAIAILAASLLVLSLIDSDKLTMAIVAISALFAELMTSMGIFTKIAGHTKSTMKACVAMISISIAVLILASALKKIADLSLGELATGLLGVTALTAVVVAAAKALGQGGKTVIKGAARMVIFAAAIKVLASACKVLSTLSWEELAKGLLGVGVLMAEVSLFLKTAKFSGKAVGTATGIVILAAAIKILASACSDFGQMSWSEIGKGLAAIGALLAELAIFTNLTGNAKHVISTGISLIAIAAAMKIFASAMTDMSGMSWEEVARGLVAMAGALVLIVAATNLMPNNMVGKGVGLIAISAAMLILANALGTMGGMSWEEIARGLVALGGAMAILAIGLNLMNGTLAGSAALIIASLALLTLVPVLTILGAMSWESIAKGLVAIAGAFTVMGVAALVLAPLVPVILALGAAFALIGVGVLGIGVGLIAASAGLSALAIAISALCAALSVGTTVIVAAVVSITKAVLELIPFIAEAIGKGIIAFCETIAGGAAAICAAIATIIVAVCDALIQSLPKIAEVLRVLLDALLDILLEFVPKIVDVGLKIIVGLLEGIANNLEDIIQAGVDIIVAFIRGVGSAIPQVINAGYKMVIDFINGIANAIDANTDPLIAAGKRLFKSVITAGVKVLTAWIPEVKSVATKIMNSGFIKGIKDKISSAVSTVKDLASKLVDKVKGFKDNFKEAAGDLINGMINGISNGASAVKEKIVSLCKGAWESVKDFFGIKSPSRKFMEIGRFLDEGLAIGLDKNASGVNKAAVGVGKQALRSLSGAVSGIASAINSNVDMNPTIRPVLDLSDVESGAKSIGGLFSDGQLVGVSGNLGAISSMMNHRNQNGTNSDVVSALNKLGAKLGRNGDTYNINGITYNDDSALNNAIGEIVRAARIERRR